MKSEIPRNPCRRARSSSSIFSSADSRMLICSLRRDATGGLHHADLDGFRPPQLGHEIGDRERREAEHVGRHGRGHGHGVPAVPGRDLLRRLPGGQGQDHGVGLHVAGAEGLDRLAGRDLFSLITY